MTKYFDDNEFREYDSQEPDWSEYVYQEEKRPLHRLSADDYVALFIAALQTIFLPLVILAIFLVIVGVFLSAFI